MSKGKGRRQPLHSEIKNLRPARKTTKAKAAAGTGAEASAPETKEAEPETEATDAELDAVLDEETAGTPLADPQTDGELADPAADATATDLEFADSQQRPPQLDDASEETSPASKEEAEEAEDADAEGADAEDAEDEDADAENAEGRSNGHLPAEEVEEIDAASVLDDSLFDALEDEERPRTNVIPIDGNEPDDTEIFLSGLIEALLFTSQRPLALKEIARAAGIDRPRARELLERLSRNYESRGICVEEVAGGFALRSSPRYASQIQKFLALRPVRLSRAQLETLAIVAYRQPVTKPEVDDIRGVDTGQVIKGLLERSLLKILGKKDEPGRPMLYGTTNDFLELLNLRALSELPTLREYTELSDESRLKYTEETGEEVSADGLDPSASTDADPEAILAASRAAIEQPEWSAAELENDQAGSDAETAAEATASEDIARAGKGEDEEEEPKDDPVPDDEDDDDDDDDADEDEDADEDDEDKDEDDADEDADDEDEDEDEDEDDEDE